MDMMKLATQLLASQLNSSAGDNADLVQSVVGSLLGDANNEGIDIGSIVSGLQKSGLADIAASWLGDGQNADISISQIESLLGSNKIQDAAAQLGTDHNELLSALQQMIPQVVDKSSAGGDLLDSVGGISGLASLASKFLK